MAVRLAVLLFPAVFLTGGTLSGFADGAQDEARVSIHSRSRQTVERNTRANLRLDVNLVLIPVTVTDPIGKPVMDLPRDRFRLLQDGAQQSITAFHQEDSPVSMGLLFDTSGSMKNRIASSVESLKLFFKTTVPEDEFFVVQFSDKASLLGGFTRSPDEIFARLGLVQAKGWTALLDALALGANQMKRAVNRRRVLLVLSDGNDNYSRFTETEVKNLIIERDVTVYAIGIAYRPRLLQQLAAQTGGNVLIARNADELPEMVQRLSAEIRSQYLLGYSPSSENDGKYHKVNVTVLPSPKDPPLRAYWRHGYYAPVP